VVVGILGLVGLRNRFAIRTFTARTVEVVRQALWTEIAIGVLIVVLAAALVNRAPTRSVASRPVSITRPIGPERRFSFTLFPARRGENTVHLYFFDKDGIVAPIDVVEVRASVNGLPPRTLDVLPVTSSHYQIRGANLPNKGTWRFDLSIALNDKESTTSVEVPIR
jgi:copper transport protein